MPRSGAPTWVPKREDYDQVLAEQNPWHSTGSVPEPLAFPIERPLAQQLWRRLSTDSPHRFELVLGPRRVGKTTAMYQTVRRLMKEGVPARRLFWFRLDHPLLLQFSLGDLVRSTAEHVGATAAAPVFLFLDELAYAQDWDLWLKTFFDERRPVRILGTSSSTAALRHRRTESGVGRWEEQYLSPYLLTEYLDLCELRVEIPVGANLAETITESVRAGVELAGIDQRREVYLSTGGFPELLLETRAAPADPASRLLQAQRVLGADAVERAVYKDIPQVFGIGNPMLLERMLYLLAAQMTGLLSPTNICRDLGGLSQPTFDRYLSYLERAFLVFTLPNYSGSERSVQKRGRKLYFVDGAVRGAALQRGIAPLSDPVEMGHILENAAAAHLHSLGQQSQVRLYHWRDGRYEVDLIYAHPERPLAFEIGRSPGHSRAGLRAFVERFPKFRGNCFVVAPGLLPLLPERSADGIGTLPLDLYLVAVGRQAQAELARRLGG